MGCSRGIAAVLVACVVSCGPKPPARPQAPAALEVRTYEPLAFKADARLATQAVILGTDDKGGSTILPLPASAPALAGAAPAPRATTPTRASDWQPARVAAALLDKSVADLDLALAPAPDASASPALVGVRYLAAWTGAAITPSATLVANLAPDGTLGPVANLADAVKAAVASGRTQVAVATGQAAELAGAATGATLVEVGDLASAYRALTGKVLPTTVPVAPADMALDAETMATLEARYKVWQQKLAIQWAAILQLESAGRIPPQLGHLRDTSKALGQTAEQLRKKKLLGAAYARVFAAVLYAQVANQAYDVLAKIQATKTDEANALLRRYASAAAPTTTTLTMIGNRTPRTVGGHIDIIAAFSSALRAWTFETFAAQAIARAEQALAPLAGKSSAELGSDETGELVIGNVVPALLYAGQTTLETTVAAEQLELAAHTDPPLVASADALRQRAAAVDAAAANERGWLEQLTATHEPDYVVARMMTELPGSSAAPAQLQQSWENGVSAALMELARTNLALSSMLELRAKYDWLGVQLQSDGSGRIAKLGHEAAFAAMLAGAERAARAHARAARVATGTIPVQARLAYQNAADARNGSRDDQLAALAQFWASSAYSELAVMLTRD